MPNWSLDFEKGLDKIQKTQNFFKKTIKTILPLTISSVWLSFVSALWQDAKSQTDFPDFPAFSANTWTSSKVQSLLQETKSQTDFEAINTWSPGEIFSGEIGISENGII